MAAFEKFIPEKEGGMKKQEIPQSGKVPGEQEPAAPRAEKTPDDGYGDSTHDHKWWGPAGRPTERKGILGHDGQESDSEENPDRTIGTHADDWREK